MKDMTNTGGDMHTITLEKGLAAFRDSLAGKNRSGATVRAYQTDIAQFIAFLRENNVSIHTPAEAESHLHSHRVSFKLCYRHCSGPGTPSQWVSLA